MHSGRPRRRLSVAVALTALTLLAVAACGGDDDKTKNTSNSSGGKLEKTKITVRVLENADVAPIFIAKSKGYFADEGLEVETKVVQSGTDTISGVLGGSLDIMHINYVSLFTAQSKGQKFRIVADDFQARPNCFVIMTKKDSGIRSVADLKGKSVAVSTPNNIQVLMDKSVLDTNGVDPEGVEHKQVAFPEMVAAATSGKVDAVALIEPFLTTGQQKGLVPVVDTATGPTADLAIAGWAATDKWAKANPNTLAAFQRAITKGQADAGSRQVLQQIVPTYTKITPQTAAVMTFGAYPTTLSQTRLQRVVDLMVRYKFIKDAATVNVAEMIGTAK